MADTDGFDDAMLDWAIAEIMSPTWEGKWHGEGVEQIRGLIRVGDPLSPKVRSALIGAIRELRKVLLDEYGVTPAWKFRLETISCAELAEFVIAEKFFGAPSGTTFGQLAAIIRIDPQFSGLLAQAEAVLRRKQAGELVYGKPIAIRQDADRPPMLIEGYKRSFAALWDRQQSIDLFIGEPPDTTALLLPRVV